MKLMLALAASFAAAFVLMAADPVTYMDNATVAKAMVKGGNIAKGTDHSVAANHREKAGEVEVHDKETDIFYVTDGEATLVTGGTMVGGRDTGPGQHREPCSRPASGPGGCGRSCPGDARAGG